MYEKYNKKIYEIKPICPSICPPKPSKPHHVRKEYYPPKPRAEGSSPSAPAKRHHICGVFFFLINIIETEACGACRALSLTVAGGE